MSENNLNHELLPGHPVICPEQISTSDLYKDDLAGLPLIAPLDKSALIEARLSIERAIHTITSNLVIFKTIIISFQRINFLLKVFYAI